MVLSFSLSPSIEVFHAIITSPNQFEQHKMCLFMWPWIQSCGVI